MRTEEESLTPNIVTTVFGLTVTETMLPEATPQISVPTIGGELCLLALDDDWFRVGRHVGISDGESELGDTEPRVCFTYEVASRLTEEKGFKMMGYSAIGSSYLIYKWRVPKAHCMLSCITPEYGGLFLLVTLITNYIWIVRKQYRVKTAQHQTLVQHFGFPMLRRVFSLRKVLHSRKFSCPKHRMELSISSPKKHAGHEPLKHIESLDRLNSS